MVNCARSAATMRRPEMRRTTTSSGGIDQQRRRQFAVMLGERGAERVRLADRARKPSSRNPSAASWLEQPLGRTLRSPRRARAHRASHLALRARAELALARRLAARRMSPVAMCGRPNSSREAYRPASPCLRREGRAGSGSVGTWRGVVAVRDQRTSAASLPDSAVCSRAPPGRAGPRAAGFRGSPRSCASSAAPRAASSCQAQRRSRSAPTCRRS